MEFDEAGGHFVVLSDAEIADWPEFPHRGVSLDVSRNFMRTEVIEDIVRGMAHSKLNVLHLHLVDTHSWPVEQRGKLSHRLTKYGAYGPDMVYTQEELKSLVKYANERGKIFHLYKLCFDGGRRIKIISSFVGLRIIPELDQPSHAGNGWQGFPEGYVLCLNKEPAHNYCSQPPCGQVN